MKRYETPRSACSSTSRLRIAACTETSSARVGSSQTTSFGSPAKARAIATRCLSPPESCTGFWVSVRSERRTRSRELRDARARPRHRATPASFAHRAHQDPAHGVAAVERRVRVLEDDLQRAEILAATLLEARRQRAALELHGAGGRPDDPEQRARQRRLAAARLADEPERLPRPDRRAHADERVDVVPLLLEDLAEVVEPHERRRRRGRSGQRRARRPPRAAAREPAPGGSSGRCDRAPPRSARAPRVRQRSSASAQRSANTHPEIARRGSGRNPGSCRAGRGPCGRRRAGCSAAARRCTGGGDPAGRSRPGPPRRAGRRRGRRRGRTSSRSRRGCG